MLTPKDIEEYPLEKAALAATNVRQSMPFSIALRLTINN